MSVDIRLLYPHFKMSQQVMHCLYCCVFFTSCCGVSDITCTDLTATNTLNDAVIQNFKLCDKLLVSAPWAGGSSPSGCGGRKG